MKFWVAVTDNSWFEYLSRLQPDEVNFWQPSARNAFRALEPGEPFLFKLHSPSNYITGGGFFLSQSFLPISLAWEAFGEKNGAQDIEALQGMILAHTRNRARVAPDPMIGCIILTKPFFLERDDWIPAPRDWSPNIVQGKTYDDSHHIGASLWAQVQQRMPLIQEGVAEEPAVYGSEYIARAPLGQGAFRVLVTEAYGKKCAITRERTLPVLDAAHIKPHALSGPHRIGNGLLLRTDLHKLLDSGYMTITGDFRVEVSRKIKEEYENGRDYYKLHGNRLELPLNELYRPSQSYIEWHNQHVFRS